MNPDPEGIPALEEASLSAWWLNTAAKDVEELIPKVAEYTSADLEVMGDVMKQWGLATDSGMEAACAWYLLGKIARCVAAYREGREPSADTLHDITVYSMMMRRIRETERWP